MLIFRPRTIASILLILGTFSACARRTTPPGPNTISGTIAKAGYSLHRWDQGLTLLILHDAPSGFVCEGSGSTSKPEYVLECHTNTHLNSALSWQIRSESGRIVRITIGTEQFVLTDDALFLARKTNGTYSVFTKDLKLSDVEFEHEAILQLAETDPEIQVFITSLQ
jgi:hypothetical protein